MGNMLTQYPELFGAIVCQVPLLDMKRYSHLLAGASWMAEYGDPDDPEQWEFIRTFSAYHQLDPDGVGALRAQLDRFWSKALAAFKEAAAPTLTIRPAPRCKR